MPTAPRHGWSGVARAYARRTSFSKVYDVAPDGTPILQHRLVSPARGRDVTRPVQVRMPGVVERFEKGHRIEVVVAAGDAAFANDPTVRPGTVRTSRSAPSVLRLPLTGELDF